MFCQRCGMEVASSYKMCPKCGGKQFAAVPQPLRNHQPHASQSPRTQPAPLQSSLPCQPAPYGRRVLATVIDFLLVMVPLVLVFAFLGYAMSDAIMDAWVAAAILSSHENALWGIVGVLTDVIFWAATVITWLYSASLESGQHQATFGKRWVGLKVIDEGGRRLSFGRATGRHFAKFLSDFTLLIGYIMPLFTERNQALHDKVAGTYVVFGGGR